ncbi:MAG: hypothetical protein NE328_17335 [Lentisphaeraceae bacterium]|nr:hypothetical protein [Lentisphaeraceae bacterium]
MASRTDRVEEYRKRIETLHKESEELKSGDGTFSAVRVVSFIATGITLAYAFLDGGISGWWAFLPGLAFVATVAIHERKILQSKMAERRVLFYENGIKRIEGDWHGTGVKGNDFKDKDHLYSDDLNLFGNASLFQKICRCSTAFGRERLAGWLKKPAKLEAIKLRQEALQELAGNDDIRNSYAELDDKESKHLAIDTFKSWALTDTNLYNPFLSFISIFLGLLTVGSLAGWLFSNLTPWMFIITLALDLVIVKLYSEKIGAVTEGISNKEKNLIQLSHVLSIIEGKEYNSVLMKDISERLKTDGVTASERIRQIANLINSFENARSNMALQPFNIMLHVNLRNAMRIERWRKVAGKSIPDWVDVAADFEALFSLSVFHHENPDYNFPEFVEKGPLVVAEKIGHPLLKPTECVQNNVELGDKTKLVLISGSNMAGKSTFLRTVGINIVLAQAGAPVCADNLKLSPISIGCSIQIEDNMSQGISHFYAEILRLKKLVDLAAESKLPVIFFFDEILHGTNSSDRCNGASAVIKNLVKSGAVGFVTTHDLSLASIVDDLEGEAVNRHFEDQFEDGKMTFDYKMKEGVVTRGNALLLMRSLGLDV